MRLLRWFAITAALGFACSIVSCQFFYQTNFRGLLRRELRVRSPSSLPSNIEGSCGESEIQQNVTLKGGIHAGYFRKLAQYVAMKLCVELCCEEKGCDVAFMTGRNCYGVQCFSEEQCQSIPAKRLPSEQIFISHVTFKGEGSHKLHEPKNLKCSATRMKVGVTLRGGLKAGNFTDVGKVDNMVICTKLCCVAEKCDLAMMINQSCFLVSCYTMQLCQVVKAISNKYQPSVAYVMRRTGELQEETATKLEALHTLDSKLMCKNSQVFYNSTLRGGYKAGNFTDLGKVPNTSACVRLCCGDKNCDAAFMLEKNCYAVACLQEDLCTPVHAKKSGALISLNPRISYITSRTEEVTSKKILSPDGTCHSGVISYDVTLRGGMSAGNFTPHGKVGSMEKCIEKCCIQKNCNAAMMLKDACFTVTCHKDELCEKKPIPTSSSFNPKIAFVYRDRKQKKKAAKHSTPTSLLQTANPTLRFGTAKYRNRPIPVRNPVVHSITQLSKAISYTAIGRPKTTFNQSSYEKGAARVSLPRARTVPKTENETARGKLNSLHEMVDFITVGTDATQGPKPKSKPSFREPVESVADQFVKLTSKVPGRPFLPLDTVLNGKAPKNPTLEQKLVGYDFEQSALSDREISGESGRQEITVINGRTSGVNNTRNLYTDNELESDVNRTVDLDREQVPTSKIGHTSSTTFGSDKATSSRLKPATTVGFALKQNNVEETESETGASLPYIVKQLEETSTDSQFEESGDGKDTELDEKSRDKLTQNTRNKGVGVINDDFSIQRFPGLSLLEKDSGCTNSEIMKNVTLRGGISSGKFKDRGWMEDFRLCIKICCLTKLCDLAFMLRNNCFTVECKSEELCEAVPVKTSAEKPPLLAYIYARSLPISRGNSRCTSSETCK